MFCPSCGNSKQPGAIRCSSCGHFSAGLLVNLFAMLLLVLTVAVNIFYYSYIATYILNFHNALSLDAPLAVRLYIAMWRFIAISWWIAAIILAAGYILLRRRTGWVARFAKSGAMLSLVALGFLLFTLYGLAGGLVTETRLSGDPIEAQMYFNQDFALHNLLYLQRAEDVYRSANPKNGFSCDLMDLSLNGGRSTVITNAAKGGDTANQMAGYRFAVIGCTGKPVSSYKITAVPVTPGRTGDWFYCSDQSRLVRDAVKPSDEKLKAFLQNCK